MDCIAPIFQTEMEDNAKAMVPPALAFVQSLLEKHDTGIQQFFFKRVQQVKQCMKPQVPLDGRVATKGG